jgi:hypothetical protein
MDAIAPLVTSYDVGLVVPSLAPADVGAAIDTILGDAAGLARMRLNALTAAQRELMANCLLHSYFSMVHKHGHPTLLAWAAVFAGHNLLSLGVLV